MSVSESESVPVSESVSESELVSMLVREVKYVSRVLEKGSAETSLITYCTDCS